MSLPQGICEAASSKNNFDVNEGPLKRGGGEHIHRAIRCLRKRKRERTGGKKELKKNQEG